MMRTIDNYETFLELHVAASALKQLAKWYDNCQIPKEYIQDGVCHFLHQQGLRIAHILDAYVDYSKWTLFSGSWIYPVPSPKVGSTAETAYSELELYEGEYGERRRAFIGFLQTQISRLLHSSTYIKTYATPLNHRLIERFAYTLNNHPEQCVIPCMDRGLCSHLCHYFRVNSATLNDIEFSNWKYYSGSDIYPVPAVKHPIFGMFYKGSPYKSYTNTKNLYEGKNLKYRQDLINFIIDQHNDKTSN